jgi:hypothetical protein
MTATRRKRSKPQSLHFQDPRFLAGFNSLCSSFQKSLSRPPEASARDGRSNPTLLANKES